MIYNPKSDFEIAKARKRLEQLITKGKPFELTDIAKRSLKANNYLHLCLSYLALEMGWTLAYTKLRIWKLTWLKDLFLIEKVSTKTGEKFTDIRSSKDLNREEMNHAIGVLIEKAMSVCNVLLPNPNDTTYQDDFLLIQREVHQNQKYL
jgi:hypothetical protein